MKQFLLSLIATTISIILTFGTSLWLENRKTEKEKREIVMMVMHDISHSIDEMENADSLLRAGFACLKKIPSSSHITFLSWNTQRPWSISSPQTLKPSTPSAAWSLQKTCRPYTNFEKTIRTKYAIRSLKR